MNSKELFAMALGFHQSGQLAEAEAAYRRVLETENNFKALNNLGNILRALHRLDEAEQMYRGALNAQSLSPEPYCNLGLLLAEQGRLDEAIDLYQRGLALAPGMAAIHFNMGIAFGLQGDYQSACDAYRAAIHIEPDFAQAYCNLGNMLRHVGRSDEVLKAYEKALALNPNDGETLFNLASLFQACGEFELAIKRYRQAYAIIPDRGLVALVHQLQMACSWSDLESLSQRIIATVDDARFTYEQFVDPYLFICLAKPTSPAQQLKCATAYSNHAKKIVGKPLGSERLRVKTTSKLNIGYLSCDLHPHPIAWLMAEIFESHNRNDFCVFAYSYGRDSESPIRKRIVDGVDVFRDVKQLSYRGIASQIVADEIDILVDIKGYTDQSRSELLALRPAPIQVNYLGFCGTMGADFIDYLLADDFVVPESQQPFYAEKTVYLPGCYYANDRRLEVANCSSERVELGLPSKGFVFCSFNDSKKITPRMFAIWMRLLLAVPDSVLWLLSSNSLTIRNLRLEAEKVGVASHRIVFAPRTDRPLHLARHAHADLFLDTFPYNAHTTACDALRMNVPLVTLSGEAFSSRVAGSLLQALGLDELITDNDQDYESLAFYLATTPDAYRSLREKLNAKLLTSTAFDGSVFAKNLEKAYHLMWQIYRQGRPAEAIRVR
jgi:protein O-GlcNAc transferase